MRGVKRTKGNTTVFGEGILEKCERTYSAIRIREPDEGGVLIWWRLELNGIEWVLMVQGLEM